MAGWISATGVGQSHAACQHQQVAEYQKKQPFYLCHSNLLYRDIDSLQEYNCNKSLCQVHELPGTIAVSATASSLAWMPDGTAQSALDGFSEALSAIPPELRKTFTYDQGREMSKHAQLTERTGVAVYCCDPHSPWQRGLNENTNGLLRQYLSKGADLSVYNQEQLDAIAWSLNTRPRKSLGFRSLVEVYTPVTGRGLRRAPAE